MRVYLAARYSRLGELNGYAKQLRDTGHTVNARWLLGDHQIHEGNGLVQAPSVSVPMCAQRFAIDDFEDVRSADAVVCFTEPARSTTTRGGRHVEAGLALAWGKIVVIVGPRENIFYTLPQISQFDEWGPSVIEHISRASLLA